MIFNIRSPTLKFCHQQIYMWHFICFRGVPRERQLQCKIGLPFKNNIKIANAVRRQIHNISIKVGISVEVIFVSQKLEQVLKPKEVKPPIVNQQYMAYSFLRDWCHMDYMLNFWLHCLTSSLMHYWTKELIDWQMPFGGPCDLVRSEWKSISYLTQFRL